MSNDTEVHGEITDPCHQNRTRDDLCVSLTANNTCSTCCDNLAYLECLSQISSPATNVRLGVSFIIALSLICLLAAVTFLKRFCSRNGRGVLDNIPISVIDNRIRPSERRTLLKTGYYTVEHNMNQLIVTFSTKGFFEAFLVALTSRYRGISWKPPYCESRGRITCRCGKPVNLSILHEPRILILTDEGNSSWVFNDFQSICKQLKLPDTIGLDGIPQSPQQRPLQPRLPTLGEEFYNTGDLLVRKSVTELAVTFTRTSSFAHFKRALLLRYPNVTWSKYLDRDCAQVTLSDSSLLTIHLWDKHNTLLLTGSGRQEWYFAEFPRLCSDLKQTETKSMFIDVNHATRAKRGGPSPENTQREEELPPIEVISD